MRGVLASDARLAGSGPPLLALAGAGSGGIEIVTRDIAYDAAGLAAGIDIYTPTPGDVGLMAWVAVVEAFDGTTPLAQMGQFSGGDANGWYQIAAGWNLAQADVIGWSGSNGLLYSNFSDNTELMAGGIVYEAYYRYPFPCTFLTADPIQVCASQTGLPGGAAVGGTAGLMAVYLMIGHPRTVAP